MIVLLNVKATRVQTETRRLVATACEDIQSSQGRDAYLLHVVRYCNFYRNCKLDPYEQIEKQIPESCRTAQQSTGGCPVESHGLCLFAVTTVRDAMILGFVRVGGVFSP